MIALLKSRQKDADMPEFNSSVEISSLRSAVKQQAVAGVAQGSIAV
jgi:hypothetical protein